MKVKNIIKILLTVVAISAFPLVSSATTKALWVGETYMCDATSSVFGLTSDISWSTSGGYISLSGSGFYRNVTATQYWSGSSTVTCSWKYRLYSGDSWKTQSISWTFTCNENPVHISPTSMKLNVGETGYVTYNHTYSNDYLSAGNVWFSSNNSNVVTVSATGVVTAVKQGTAYINVHSNLSNAANAPYCMVTVSEGAESDNNVGTNENSTSETKREIHLSEAGTLSSYISNEDKYSIIDLTLSGCINGSDLRLLRDMAGFDHNQKVTNGKLQNLNLRNAVIVSGGSWYIEESGTKYYTSDLSSSFPPFVFEFCSQLTEIYLPLITTNIQYWALHWCKKMEHIELPIGLNIIGTNNMTFCTSLKTLTIPSTVTEILTNFYGSESLQYIYCNAAEPPVMKDVFSKNTKIREGILYVPKGTSSKYWKAKGWCDFGDIVELDDIRYPIQILIKTIGGSVVYQNVHMRKQTQDDTNLYDGRFTLDLPKNNEMTLAIEPDKNYIIEKVLLGDTDITTEVLDGSLIIKGKEMLQKVEIYFKQTTASAHSLSFDTDDNIQIHTLNDGICIKGASAGERINVYTLIGNSICSVQSNGEDTMIMLVKNNVYIVNIGKRKYKIVL